MPEIGEMTVVMISGIVGLVGGIEVFGGGGEGGVG
jgi:hypothetical protein